MWVSLIAMGTRSVHVWPGPVIEVHVDFVDTERSQRALCRRCYVCGIHVPIP